MVEGCEREEAYARDVDAGEAYLRRRRLGLDTQTAEPARGLRRLRGLAWRARESFLLGYRAALGGGSAREVLRRQRERRGG